MKKTLALTTALLITGCDNITKSIGRLNPLFQSSELELDEVEKRKLRSLLQKERLELAGAENHSELNVLPSWEFDQEAHLDLNKGRNPASQAANGAKSYYIRLKYEAPHDDILRADGRFFSGWGTHYKEVQRLIQEHAYEMYCANPSKEACAEYDIRKRKDFDAIKEKIEKKMKIVGVYGKGETFKVVYRKLEIGSGNGADDSSPEIILRKPANIRD